MLAQCDTEWLHYAASPERGEYRGFAALHDKCDANMLLPFAETTDDRQGPLTNFWNAVMDEVKRRIIDSYGC